MMKPRHPYSVVVADDDRACRQTLRDILIDRGFNTYEAGTGREAIEIVETLKIDIGFLDYQMPDMTGIDTLRIIREINPGLQCVLVTGSTEPYLTSWAEKVGALELLHKPVRMASITSVLHQMIERFKSLRSRKEGNP